MNAPLPTPANNNASPTAITAWTWVRSSTGRLPPAGDQGHYLLALAAGGYVVGHPLTLRRALAGQGFVHHSASSGFVHETHWVDRHGNPIDGVAAWCLIARP